MNRDKAKTSLSLQQLPRGLEIGSRTRHNPNFDRDEERFRELDEKLRRLAEMSRTSHETFVGDDNQTSVASASAAAKTSKNVTTISAQTSLTDLTNLGKRPG